MDVNIWEGTINGVEYAGPLVAVGIVGVFGYLAYDARKYKHNRALAMYERGYLDEQPTFWNTGRILRKYNKGAVERGLKILADIDLPPREGSIEYNRRMQEEKKQTGSE